jgi:hypothetical protein
MHAEQHDRFVLLASRDGKLFFWADGVAALIPA